MEDFGKSPGMYPRRMLLERTVVRRHFLDARDGVPAELRAPEIGEHQH